MTWGFSNIFRNRSAEIEERNFHKLEEICTRSSSRGWDARLQASKHPNGSESWIVDKREREAQRLVGNLIYLAHTRPNIAYVVGVVSLHACPSRGTLGSYSEDRSILERDIQTWIIV